jgi:hypothetical protein
MTQYESYDILTGPLVGKRFYPNTRPLGDPIYNPGRHSSKVNELEENVSTAKAKTMKIFVSYSRSDAGDFAEQIRKHLTAFNHSVFIDIGRIDIGDIWNDIIEDNISKCDIFVVIITHGSLISQHVDKEVLQAQQEKKRIIPCVHKNVYARGVGYTNSKWGLEKIQGIEFSNEYNLARDLYLKIEQYQKGNLDPQQ